MLVSLLYLSVTYLICSIPFGLIISKVFAGQDIRESGSKNIGATNVARVVGKKLGVLTLILDALKGAIMVIVAKYVFADLSYLRDLLVVIALVAVLGHVFPIYLNFKGGKGVATTVAVLFALNLVLGISVSVIWLIIFSLFRISAVASLISIFLSIFLANVVFGSGLEQVLCIALFVLIFYRHKENISRIIKGEEKKL